ncbi:MAG: sigma-70 family RNA polymerase sigma factor [Planctomycetota bacterium]|jgi:RNA polymerase sigma factor (sigma-70 family)
MNLIMERDACQPLEEARRLLERLKDPHFALEKTQKLHLEEIAFRLLSQFQKSADCRYFNAFYHITRGVFFSYTFSHIRKFSQSIDAEDVLNRMYIILFEKLLAPHGDAPLDYLFPWCYRVIFNLVREEFRNLSKPLPITAHVAESLSSCSVLEECIEKEEETAEKLKLDQVMEILFSGKSGLSRRDRKIMRRFYLEGRSIQEIGVELNLTKANVGVILMRTRRRIARMLAE